MEETQPGSWLLSESGSHLRETGGIDFFTIVIAVISLILLLHYKVNSTWLIAGGAIAGLLFPFIR